MIYNHLEVIDSKISMQDQHLRIVLDSREVKPGDIFIAIKGTRVDGNDYVIEALNKGTSLAVVDNIKFKDFNSSKILYVQNTIKSLKRLGKYYRNISNPTIIGITGSCGKTTTRVWIENILSKHLNTCASIKNFNTMLSLSMCLSMLNYSTQVGVFELGTNSTGEISELSRYLKPNIGIITNIYESHIGMFNSVEALANEKVSIISGIKSGGYLIYDGDSQFKNLIIQRCIDHNITPISIGFNDICNYKINYNNDKINLNTPKTVLEYTIGAVGKHYAYISAFIIAIIDILGLDINDYIEYFKKLMPIQGRGLYKQYSCNNKRFTVIDESYNASPSAVLATLELLRNIKNRKIIVLGQMKELGKYTEYYHDQISKKLKDIDIYKTYFIGKSALWPIMNKYKTVKCFENISEQRIKTILENIQDDDILLIKGSRSMNLEYLIKYLDGKGCKNKSS